MFPSCIGYHSEYEGEYQRRDKQKTEGDKIRHRSQGPIVRSGSEILGEIHTRWKPRQTSLGFWEKCEHIPLTGWKTLSGAIAVFPAAVPVWFHWRLTSADGVGNSRPRRQGFLRNVFHGTVSRSNIYLGRASTGESGCCGGNFVVFPYKVNGSKLIINQQFHGNTFMFLFYFSKL